MIEPIIQAKDIEITFNVGKSNEYHALRKESIEIYPQEFIILFGPSGCGKSTLLYSILGILPPTSGEMIIKGENIYNYTPNEMVRFQTKVIGIIYQAFFLIPSISILDNVSLPLIFSGIDPTTREKRAMELMKRFGVDKQAHKLPAALSGGQCQRVAVSRALVSDPEILLADEPVGNLDSVSSNAVMETLLEINEKDKKTVILVTHDAKHLKYAHRIYYVRDGKLEREVINPMKTQIKQVEKGKMVFTEVDKLSRVYPYASPAELRVKSIINYLTQDIDFDQIERLEAMIKAMVEGKMNRDDFYLELVRPFDQGGVGIIKTKAQKMADQVDRVLNESVDIARFMRNPYPEEDADEDRQKDLMKRIRKNLLDEYSGEVNAVQVARLEEAIRSRIVGDIRGTDFRKLLNTSIDEGGGGFDTKTCRQMTDHMEKILTQGIKEF